MKIVPVILSDGSGTHLCSLSFLKRVTIEDWEFFGPKEYKSNNTGM
jgi:hypothetical protein